MRHHGMWIAGALVLAANPVYAYTATTASVKAQLQQQGLSVAAAARLANEAQAQYHGQDFQAVAKALKAIPPITPTDSSQTMNPAAQKALTQVLTVAFMKGVPASRVQAAGGTLVGALNQGAGPSPVARLVITGLTDGLRGQALAAVVREYLQGIHQGLKPSTAYGVAMQKGKALERAPEGAGLQSGMLSSRTEQSMAAGSGVMGGAHTGMGPTTGGMAAGMGTGTMTGGTTGGTTGGATGGGGMGSRP